MTEGWRLTIFEDRNDTACCTVRMGLAAAYSSGWYMAMRELEGCDSWIEGDRGIVILLSIIFKLY
ncbi:MAG: hypothetical protein AL399_08265 [Candidatus [Bacteroides] periocalifornicus]|uniref:Uncharacterized protein n=1 Tax=Candidatus [Bacteroides] periocalifornicus TaxID=1702214 RepID=A0A0Q4B6Q3_9BACT|nr:MAG: hypothetical protein AL399_08265 [Candidatus [Bacteroides] periocalifornicus]